jgi:DNA-binding response OmpR family regulator
MLRVLLVDDDRSIRLLIRRMLTSLRCEVEEADNGVAALEKLSTRSFSLAILDLGMPLLNGFEVLQAIRSSPEHAGMPVIIVSGAADQPTALGIVGLGVTDFIAKPFRFDQFKARLTAAVQNIEPPPKTPPARPTSPTTVPEGARLVLLVDSNAEFRRFVASILAPQHPVAQAESGQEAVCVCAAHRPVAVIVGPDIGLFGPALLARKLRTSVQIEETRLLLAARPDQVAQIGDTSMFDAVINRTFVPDEIRDQFHRAVEQLTPA